VSPWHGTPRVGSIDTVRLGYRSRIAIDGASLIDVTLDRDAGVTSYGGRLGGVAMPGSSAEPRAVRRPTLADAIVPLVLLAGLIAGALALFGLDALDGPIQVALMLCCMVATLIILKNGHSWEEIQHAGQGAMASITSAVFILLAVGALIGVWNLSGTIPTLVYYGIQALSPTWYYAATALICGAIALSIGSSWTTAGTIGVGLVGIAVMLGVSPEITAGAVISGAYLGDKTSPLSETTILTAQLAKVDLHAHIRSQVWTSVPAFVIAFLLFLGLGFVGPEVDDEVRTTVELASLNQIYWITPLTLLPLLLLVVLSIRKVPASLALMASALFAGVLAPILQYDVVEDFVPTEGNPLVTSVRAVWLAMANGFEISSGIPEIDALLSRGGMDSMLLTLWLIIGAVTFGALLEEFGLISRLVDPMITAAHTTGRLYVTVFTCGFGLNVVAGDQYIALVLPTKVFRAEFAKRGLASTNLSRLAADSGTVTSPLVPWNSCGAFMGAVLGVSTLLYLPYAFFNLISPLLSVLYGFTGFKVERTQPPVTAE
jgi:Na+:H+ antiporter, NhaC family